MVVNMKNEEIDVQAFNGITFVNSGKPATKEECKNCKLQCTGKQLYDLNFKTVICPAKGKP